MADTGFTNKIVKGLSRYLGGDVIPRKSTEISGAVGHTDRQWRSLSRLNKTTKEALHRTRTAKYDEYEYLDDNLAEGGGALNLYADNVVSGAIGGAENYKVVISKDVGNIEEIEEVIRYNEQRSRIKDAVWEIARDITGYGDEFRELVIAQDDSGQYFINKLKHLPVREIIANVDSRGVFTDANKMYVQRETPYDRVNIAEFEWWRLIHFKIGQGVYGVDRSIFAGAAVRIGRQLLWIDEALVIARMSRAWMRYAYLVDVEGMNPEEAWDYIETFMSQMTRKEIVDKDTGRVSVADRPPLPDEDIAVPVTKDSKQDIKVLSGDPNIGHIEDVKYLQNKFLMAVSVPKAYMAIEEGVRAKATIQQIDVQFARQVRRRQRSIIPGLRHFYKIAFVLNGIDPNSFKWDIVFPELATTDELLRWELEKTKAEIAKIYMIDIGSLNDEWLYNDVLGFSKAEIKKYATKLGKTPPPPGSPGMAISPHIAAAIRKNPEVRQLLNDINDIVAYKIGRDADLEGMVAIEGAQRTGDLGDND